MVFTIMLLEKGFYNVNYKTTKPKREKIVKARLSEEEYNRFSEKCKLAGATESELIRRSLSDTNIQGNVSNSRNAMIHICNMEKVIQMLEHKYSSEVGIAIDELREELNELCQFLK